MGSPASNQRQKLLVKHQKCVLLQLSSAVQRNARSQHSLGLHPINEIALLREAVAHLGFRVALLDVLLDSSAIVRDFDYKFRHLPTFPLFFQRVALPAQSNIPLTILSRCPPGYSHLEVPQVTSMDSALQPQLVPKFTTLRL